MSKFTYTFNFYNDSNGLTLSTTDYDEAMNEYKSKDYYILPKDPTLFSISYATKNNSKLNFVSQEKNV